MNAEVFKKHVLGKKVLGIRKDVPTGEHPSMYGADDVGDALELEDGTLLNIYMSDQDCCAGAHGEWKVLAGPGFHGGITDVELRNVKKVEEGYDQYTTATLNILYGNETIAKSNLYADSGNEGYYFSVLSLQVIVPDGRIAHEEELISS